MKKNDGRVKVVRLKIKELSLTKVQDLWLAQKEKIKWKQ